MSKKLKKLFREKRELVLYIFFGGLTTAVGYGSYWFFRWLISGESTIVPNTLKWICAVTFAYLTNRKWVFESKQTRPSALIREAALFYGGRLLTLGVDIILMVLLVDLPQKYGLWELFALIIVSVVVLVLNYIISKLFVFRKKKK